MGVRRWWVAGLAAGLVAAASPVVRADEFTLDNGLRVWLHPVANAKHTAVVLVFDLGERQDPEGQSGLAHLVEHCWVTAAAGTRPMRTVADWVAAVPTARNAQTGPGYTVIAEVVDPAAALDAVRGQAERMGALRITEADLAREIPRLATELGNMFEHLPSLAACNTAGELVRPSPAGARKGGVLAQIRALTPAEVQARWAACYKPRNARLMVAGAFNATALRATVEAAFGPLPAGDPVPAAREPSPAAPGTRRDLLVTPARAGLPAVAAIAVRAPEPDDRAFAPFCVGLMLLWDRQMTRRTDHVVVQFAPLDNPGVACIATAIGAGETPDAAVQRLHDFVDAALAVSVESLHRERAKATFAQTLGTAGIARPQGYEALYAVAFRHARLAQLGVEPAAMTRRFNAVIPQTFERMRAEVFGLGHRGVVTASLKP